jgi:hypothetical protein
MVCNWNDSRNDVRKEKEGVNMKNKLMDLIK